MYQDAGREASQCSGKLWMVWGAYGVAMAALAHETGGPSSATAWAVAAAIGLALLLCTRAI